MKILDIGCGRSFAKIASDPNAEVIRLDREAYLEPNIVCNVGVDRIPLEDNSIDIVLAIHSLEHIGRQGETKEWFYAFEEIYRILKPDGILHFESPMHDSLWAWGDPSHTRALCPESFMFFSQNVYREKGTRISPYRIKCDFESVGFLYVTDGNKEIASREPHSHFRGDLKAIKPLRVWWEDEMILVNKSNGKEQRHA